MALLHKYRPNELKDFEIHREVALNLKQLVSQGDMPHCLLYGPSGAGKKTMVRAMLREIYGNQVFKIRVDTSPWIIELPNKTIEVEMTRVSSAHHVEIIPSDAGFQDQYVVQEAVKQVASQISAGQQKFKVIYIKCADKMSQTAQHSLRRTMEKFSSNARFILSCNNLANITDPLQSRCICIRVPMAEKNEVKQFLTQVCGKEGMNVPQSFLEELLRVSGGNMRTMLLSLQATLQINGGTVSESTQPIQTPWQMEVRDIARIITEKQNHEQIMIARDKLYGILVKNISGTTILEKLVQELLQMRLDDQVRLEIVKLASNTSHRLTLVNKEIFVLEEFVAQVMSDYSQYLSSLCR